MLTNLGRAFAAKPRPVVALKGLNLTLYEGQITALLGQNGAGKTTTIGILTGLFPQSEGDAVAFGRDVATQMDGVRALSGVCPQHDLVFAALTCLDNLRLVGSVKGMDDAALAGDEPARMLRAVGLAEDKFAARADTLSGGQKRKLSLACALIGDPKFVLLDEPTAGMDPASRRTVWGIMSRFKAERAIVLTTHFLDEADALGDRVAILHKGRLQAVGSTSELKRQAGTSFHLTISRASADGGGGGGGGGAPAASALLALAARHVGEGATIKAEAPHEVALSLPQAAAPRFAPLFDELDRSAARLGIASYGLAIPTLQEVFLKITADADARLVALEEAKLLAEGDEGANKKGKTGGKRGKRGRRGDATELATVTTTTTDDEEAAAAGGGRRPRLAPNWRQQIKMGLVLIKLQMSDPLALAFLGVPGLLVALVFLLPPVLDGSAPPAQTNHSDPSALKLVRLTAAAWPPSTPLPYAPADVAPLVLPSGGAGADGAGAAHLSADAMAVDALNPALELPTTGAFGASVVGAAAATEWAALTGGANWTRWDNRTDGGALGNYSVLLHNASAASALPVLLHTFDAALMALAAPSVALETRAGLLPYVGSDPPPLPSFVGSLVTAPALCYVFMFVGMVIIQQLVKDRLVEKTTHQLMVMGLSPLIRWVNSGIFWCGIMWSYLLLPVVFVAAFGDYTPYAEATPAFLLTVLVAVPPLFCFLALFNFAFWCRTNVEDVVGQTYCNIISLVVFYPSLLLSAIPFVRDDPTAKSAITYGLLFIPFNQITFGLAAIYTVAQVAAYEQAYDATASPLTVADYFVWLVDVPNVDGGTDQSPGPLLCIAFSLLTAPFWFWALWRIDVRRYYYAAPPVDWAGEAPRDEDPDVAAERRAVEGGARDGALVRMVHLRRTFAQPKKGGAPQPPKVAVADLSLAIDGAGCFALLGPNGAGKTTTLSMLTGDVKPTAGEAWVAGHSVRTDIMAIFKLLGYCPQFGGLFPRGVSLRQHLQLFGRLKGIPEAELDGHCDRTIAEFGLQDHAHKWVTKLSGGTRRKLVAAIALACEPQVCFLDEPTTGVDVGTRQFLWDRINAKGKRGCALVLTTHYMEEADALAQRVGIMVNGGLQVLGSPQQLKSKHGGGYRVELKGPPETAERARRVVEGLFPGTVKLEGLGGFQVFEVGGGSRTRKAAAAAGAGAAADAVADDAYFRLGPVFAALDAAKAELGLETYTLSQTTLEQVFLNIAAAQQDDDAAAAATAAAAEPQQEAGENC